MRAVVLAGYGGPEVLRLEEVEAPVPGPDEVLVEVVSTAVTHDLWRERFGDTARNLW